MTKFIFPNPVPHKNFDTFVSIPVAKGGTISSMASMLRCQPGGHRFATQEGRMKNSIGFDSYVDTA